MALAFSPPIKPKIPRWQRDNKNGLCEECTHRISAHYFADSDQETLMVDCEISGCNCRRFFPRDNV